MIAVFKFCVIFQTEASFIEFSFLYLCISADGDASPSVFKTVHSLVIMIT